MSEPPAKRWRVELGLDVKINMINEYESKPKPSLKLIKRWKIRWFTLHEDELRCYPKKDKSVVIETIPLQGASVVCPCYDEPEVNVESHGQCVDATAQLAFHEKLTLKLMFPPHAEKLQVPCGKNAFKLTTPNGGELLFEAAGIQDRDRWAHAIGAVIRSITSSSQISSSPVKFQHFRSKANVSEVLGALQDPDAGVEMKSHVRNGTVHKNCFKGSDITQWLLRWNIVRKRNDGIALAQSLLKLGHLQEVDLSDGAAGATQFFKDDEKLYRFTSLNLGVQRNSYFDSSDSDSSLSDDEEDAKIPDKVKKGKVIKEGFLCKKKSLRKGWRFVRVLLRDNPPLLEYECPYQQSSKDPKIDSKPSKWIDLQKCYLVDSSSSTTAMEDDRTQQPSSKLRVYIRAKGRRCRTFQTKDEEEWFEYMTLLHTLCQGKSTPSKSKTSI